MKLPKHKLEEIDYWEDISTVRTAGTRIHWKGKKWYQSSKQDFYFDNPCCRSGFELGLLVRYYGVNDDYLEFKQQLTTYFDSVSS